MREFRFRFIAPKPLTVMEKQDIPTTIDHDWVEYKVFHSDYGAAYNIALRQFINDYPETDPIYRRHRGWW